MSTKTTKTSGGGHSVITTREGTGWLGEDTSTTRTVDYGPNGAKTGEHVVDSRGNVWECDSTGRTVRVVGTVERDE